MLELFAAAPDESGGIPHLDDVGGGCRPAGLGRRLTIYADRAGKNQRLRALPAPGQAALHKQQIKPLTP